MTKLILQQNSTNFPYVATFLSSNTCQMWRISDFSTSVMWKFFFQLWRIFLFPHNCFTWKAENPPLGNFSLLIILVILVTNMRSGHHKNLRRNAPKLKQETTYINAKLLDPFNEGLKAAEIGQNFHQAG